MSSELEGPVVAVKGEYYIIISPHSTNEKSKEGQEIDFKYRGVDGVTNLGGVVLTADNERAEVSVLRSLPQLKGKTLDFYYSLHTNGDRQDSKVTPHPNVGA